jgi:hypothetical protein
MSNPVRAAGAKVIATPIGTTILIQNRSAGLSGKPTSESMYSRFASELTMTPNKQPEKMFFTSAQVMNEITVAITRKISKSVYEGYII